MTPAQTKDDKECFLGIMVLKDGKWKPHSKFSDDKFGAALIKAEEVDAGPDFDAVKLMRIPAKGAPESKQKEMWISPRLKARSQAEAQQKISAGVKQSRNSIAADYAARKSKSK